MKEAIPYNSFVFHVIVSQLKTRKGVWYIEEASFMEVRDFLTGIV